MQTIIQTNETTLSNDFSPKTAAICFWSIVGFFAVIWVLLPTLFHTGYRIHDVIELQSISKEWVLSTRKHPMLPAWILEIVNILTNRNFAAPFIASQICVMITLWSVWQLGRKVLSEKSALIGALAILPYYFFTYHSLVYNQNTVLIAFWSLSVYFVFQAFQTNRFLYWILSGLAIGFAFHAKYPAAFLVLSILIFMFTRSEGRKLWCGIRPYLTTIIAFLIFLPHLVWLYQNDFATFDYANNRHIYSDSIYRILAPMLFTIYQMEYWFSILIVLYPALGFAWNWKLKILENKNEKIGEQYLFYCFIIPFLLCITISMFKNCWLSASYSAPFWTFLGIWLLLRFQVNESPNTFFNTVKLTILLELIMCLLLIISVFTPYVNGQQKKQLFPTRELGIQCDQIWYSKFNTPCPFVSGEWAICGYAGWAMRDSPRVHFYWNIYHDGINYLNEKPTGTWSADSDVNQQGGMIFWQLSDKPDNYIPDWLHKRFPNAEIMTEPIILPYKTRAKVPPLKVGVAIIPPTD
ncbi:MAG: glycosyltransferase family 39 protein [Planctomycetaceae bacterium]|jgi:hypothetical protein|nr:glycosyltransferase family 39 protein [Planctomycetaceae bacterium]